MMWSTAGFRSSAFTTEIPISPVGPVIASFLWLDRYEPEPVRLLVTAFFWGAVVATAAALVLQALDQHTRNRGIAEQCHNGRKENQSADNDTVQASPAFHEACPWPALLIDRTGAAQWLDSAVDLVGPKQDIRG